VKFFYTFLLLLIANSLIAQTVYDGYSSYAALLASKKTSDRASIIATNQLINSYLAQNPQGGHAKTVITIPVVVHVLYHDISQNISDAQVQSQIKVLNEDYRRLNADTSNTRAVFKGAAADCQLNFKLATQDVNGMPTTGILHSYTDTAMWDNRGDPYHISQQMKDSAAGGQNTWNPSCYLNIWVCNIYSNLLGYSSLPGDPANEDGVVISYRYFGSGAGTLAPYDKGRTTTHEIGHWLGLYHPFEGACIGLNSATCATTGDFCCDTPPTANASFGCDQTQNSCTEIPNMPDMIENYMMYTDDNCMNLFSHDQATRMQATLNAVRSGIATCSGATTIPLLTNDIGVYYIYNAIGNSQYCPFVSKVRVHNYGNNTVTAFTVTIQIDNDAVHQYTWTGNLPSTFNADVTLTSISPLTTATYHKFKAWTTLPNNVTDANPLNDMKVSNFTCLPDGLNNIEVEDPIFTLYPNPAETNCTLSTATFTPGWTFSISNQLGQEMVSKMAITNTSTNISLENFTSGIYFISIINANGKRQNKKLIKN